MSFFGNQVMLKSESPPGVNLKNCFDSRMTKYVPNSLVTLDVIFLYDLN